MKKNSNKDVELTWEIRKAGNWNRKNTSLPKVNTKPITVIKIDGDEFVWKHEEIFKLIKAYIVSDYIAMEMIVDKDIDTGEINDFEISLVDKVRDFLKGYTVK